jgi:hypothetical protein
MAKNRVAADDGQMTGKGRRQLRQISLFFVCIFNALNVHIVQLIK